MSVDRGEVERIADLAKLRLTDDEVDRLTDEMNRILRHAERLRDVAEGSDDVDAGMGRTGGEPGGADGGGSGVGPTPAPAGTRRQAPVGTRRLEAESPDPLASRLADLAPDMREGFFVVPPPPGVTAEEHDQAVARGDDAEGG